MQPKRHTRWRRQAGQSLIETGFVILAILAVVFSVFEIGWLMYTYSVLGDAVNEGVRYAIVHSGGDPAGTQARVKTFAATSMHNVSAISVSVTFPNGSAAPPNLVRVTVTYTYVPWLNNFINTPTLRTYAEGRMIVQ